MLVRWAHSHVETQCTREPTASQKHCPFRQFLSAQCSLGAHPCTPPPVSMRDARRHTFAASVYLEHLVLTESGRFRSNTLTLVWTQQKGLKKSWVSVTKLLPFTSKSVYVNCGYFITQTWGPELHRGNLKLRLSCTCVCLKVTLTLYTFFGIIDYTKLQTHEQKEISNRKRKRRKWNGKACRKFKMSKTVSE